MEGRSAVTAFTIVVHSWLMSLQINDIVLVPASVLASVPALGRFVGVFHWPTSSLVNLIAC